MAIKGAAQRLFPKLPARGEIGRNHSSKLVMRVRFPSPAPWSRQVFPPPLAPRGTPCPRKVRETSDASRRSEARQGISERPVPVLACVLVAERGSWAGVSTSAHQLRDRRPRRGRPGEPRVAKVMQVELRAPNGFPRVRPGRGEHLGYERAQRRTNARRNTRKHCNPGYE